MTKLSKEENKKRETDASKCWNGGQSEKATSPVNAGKQILESLIDGSIYLAAPETSHLCLLLPETE